MYSIRRWLYKPKREDPSLLAQFFYADEELNMVAAELDSFDGRKDPERCQALINQLRQCQDKVVTICNQVMDETIPSFRANRDFRIKFPDDILQENLAGQLWFGAECLAAGSSILNREIESAAMRPLAKMLTKSLENVRYLLREQCLRNPQNYSERVKDALRVFDRFFAEFELSYVSAMVPVKTAREHDLQQNLIVLFSETLQRALRLGLVNQEMVDDYDPALMFTIPRLAIVCGLLIYPEGPLNMDVDQHEMSEMFRPFHNLLRKIRELLWTLNRGELYILEKALSQMEAPKGDERGANANSMDRIGGALLYDVSSYVQQLYRDFPTCKQLVNEFCGVGLFHPSGDNNEANIRSVPENRWNWGLSQASTDAGNSSPSSRLVIASNNDNSDPECSRSPSCHSCRSSSSSTSTTVWDSHSTCSSDTSSYTSEGPDDEEIALALQAAEIANREEARSRFRDSQDLVHRLFVCISGVADQLQSNYASDLRNILKCVFEMNCSEASISSYPSPSESGQTTPTYTAASEVEERASVESAEEASETDDDPRSVTQKRDPPPWIPDELAPQCMSCLSHFTVVRRRHHCRCCGKVFCGRCSSSSTPLPHFGYRKRVRVCDDCFSYIELNS